MSGPPKSDGRGARIDGRGLDLNPSKVPSTRRITRRSTSSATISRLPTARCGAKAAAPRLVATSTDRGGVFVQKRANTSRPPWIESCRSASAQTNCEEYTPRTPPHWRGGNLAASSAPPPSAPMTRHQTSSRDSTRCRASNGKVRGCPCGRSSAGDLGSSAGSDLGSRGSCSLCVHRLLTRGLLQVRRAHCACARRRTTRASLATSSGGRKAPGVLGITTRSQGPTVASAYFRAPETDAECGDDHWARLRAALPRTTLATMPTRYARIGDRMQHVSCDSLDSLLELSPPRSEGWPTAVARTTEKQGEPSACNRRRLARQHPRKRGGKHVSDAEESGKRNVLPARALEKRHPERQRI